MQMSHPPTPCRDSLPSVNSTTAREPLRVLALMDGRTVTGPLRQLAAVVSPLREAGIDLRVVVFKRRGMVVEPHVQFLRGQGIDPTILTDRTALDPAPLRQFNELVRTWKPVVVQTHGYRPTAIAWFSGLAGRSWRWIGWFHGATTENRKVRLYHTLDRLLLPSADQVVVVADAHAARFARARAKLELVYNASLDPAPVAGGAGSPVKAQLEQLTHPRLAVVGRLSPEKGTDVMLRALVRLRERSVHATLAIAGDGPEREALEQLSDQLGLADVVRFLGHVDDVRVVYQNTDVVVLPSHSEGLPNTLLEALRAARPVVATTVGAIPVVLSDPEAGVLVAPADPGALADGIVRSLPLMTSEGARIARLRTVERFGLPARVQRHLDLYEKVLGAG